MHPSCVGVLDERRFAGVLIDPENGDGVFASDKDRLGLEVRGAAGAVGHIHEPAIGMHVDGAHGLSRSNVVGSRQGVLREQRCAAETSVGLSLVHLQLVLPFQRDEHPRP